MMISLRRSRELSAHHNSAAGGFRVAGSDSPCDTNFLQTQGLTIRQENLHFYQSNDDRVFVCLNSIGKMKEMINLWSDFSLQNNKSMKPVVIKNKKSRWFRGGILPALRQTERGWQASTAPLNQRMIGFR